jgi:hypothetical protein
MNNLFDVLDVQPLPGYRLKLKFENDRKRINQATTTTLTWPLRCGEAGHSLVFEVWPYCPRHPTGCRIIHTHQNKTAEATT